MSTTKEEKKIIADEAAAEKVANAEAVKAEKVATAAEVEADKVEEERLNKLTFAERIIEARKEGYQIGEGDATGIADSTQAKQFSPIQARLTVIKDEVKYDVSLDELTHSDWYNQAVRLGKILGVTFDLKDFGGEFNEQSVLVQNARSAAIKAGGTFVPDKAEKPEK